MYPRRQLELCTVASVEAAHSCIASNPHDLIYRGCMESAEPFRLPSIMMCSAYGGITTKTAKASISNMHHRARPPAMNAVCVLHCHRRGLSSPELAELPKLRRRHRTDEVSAVRRRSGRIIRVTDHSKAVSRMPCERLMLMGLEGSSRHSHMAAVG